LNRIKKKRKSNGTEESAGSDVIALGTSAGTILLYSVNRGVPQKQLTGGHSDKIHGLCWNHTGTSLFSCSADRKIVEWDVVKGVISRYVHLNIVSLRIQLF
jgi:U3 small nucleolar RNA-associated protein 5